MLLSKKLTVAKFDRNYFCSQSGENESASAVTAPADSGQTGGSSHLETEQISKLRDIPRYCDLSDDLRHQIILAGLTGFNRGSQRLPFPVSATSDDAFNHDLVDAYAVLFAEQLSQLFKSFDGVIKVVRSDPLKFFPDIKAHREDFTQMLFGVDRLFVISHGHGRVTFIGHSSSLVGAQS